MYAVLIQTLISAVELAHIAPIADVLLLAKCLPAVLSSHVLAAATTPTKRKACKQICTVLYSVSTRRRQHRSASAGRLHSSADSKGKASPSRQNAESSAKNKQPQNSRRHSKTPRSPQMPAESVASQGQTTVPTPQSSASTGQSHVTADSGKSRQPRWQQSTAASSRHQNSNNPVQSAKDSFLQRLQAQGGATAPDNQKQHDAKALEMKAKLQEWRQQQQMQKQQQQQKKLAEKVSVKDAQGQAFKRSTKQAAAVQPTGTGRASSVDSV